MIKIDSEQLDHSQANGVLVTVKRALHEVENNAGNAMRQATNLEGRVTRLEDKLLMLEKLLEYANLVSPELGQVVAGYKAKERLGVEEDAD